jgi:hypothetical protein
MPGMYVHSIIENEGIRFDANPLNHQITTIVAQNDFAQEQIFHALLKEQLGVPIEMVSRPPTTEEAVDQKVPLTEGSVRTVRIGTANPDILKKVFALLSTLDNGFKPPVPSDTPGPT